MRVSSFWLLAVPILVMAVGVWNGWAKPEVEKVRFGRTQFDLLALGKGMEGRELELASSRSGLEEVLRKVRGDQGMEGIQDAWGREFRAAMLLGGSGKVVFFSTGPDGISSLSDRSDDDIFPGTSADIWAAAQDRVAWYRGAALVAAGFLVSQAVVRRMGAFPRELTED